MKDNLSRSKKWVELLEENAITPGNKALLSKLISAQVVKKFSTFYGTRKFITSFTRTGYRTLS
jgi:hypothetical protein